MFDYIVQPNDTIYSITRLFGITTAQLLSVNPELQYGGGIAVGQTLNIPQAGGARPVIEVNGDAYPTVSDNVLENVLPYLTYLSILSYNIRPDGTLSSLDDSRLIGMARQNGVAPLMVITNIDPSIDPLTGFSGALTHTLLSDARLSQTLIANIIATLGEKQYYGVNISLLELYPSDYIAFAGFLQALTLQLHPLNYILVVSPRINTLLEQQAALIQANSYFPFNNNLDRLILRTTEWVCTFEYREISYIDELQAAIDFTTPFISNPKVLLSIPGCCYDLMPGPEYSELYRILTSAQADELVLETGGTFRIDPRSRRSYFTYFSDDGVLHEVVCQSDTNLRAPLDLVEAYNLGGVSFHTIEDFSVASYQMVTAEFVVRKASL